MSDAQPAALSDQIAALSNSVADVEARESLLKIEARAVNEQLDVMAADNDRLRARVEQLTGALETAANEIIRLKRTLTNAASTLSAGLNSLRPASELRGSPQRPIDTDPANLRVVKAGPQGA